jgi:hypothetical protein
MSNDLVEPAPPNRLTIGFLMLWTVGASLVLGANRGLRDADVQAQSNLTHSLYILCYSITIGVAIASVGLFLHRKMTGRAGFPTQPGHWFLLIRGFSTIAWPCGWTSRVAIERWWDHPGLPDLYLALQTLPAVTVATAGYIVAWFTASPTWSRGWRLTLGLMQWNAILGLIVTFVVMVVAAPGYQLLPSAVHSCVSPLIFLLLIVTWATDPDRPSRDFLHVAGVVSTLLILILPYAFFYIPAFFR